MSRTSPISTSLYRILVLFASRSSALWKRISTLVPCASFSWITTKAPERTPTAGRTQWSASRDHRERAGTADGRSSEPGLVGSVMGRRIPQKPLVEGPRREQRQDHHGGEGPCAPADDDRRKRLDLHQC